MKKITGFLTGFGFLAVLLLFASGCNNSVGGYVPSSQPLPLTGEEEAGEDRSGSSQKDKNNG